MEVAEEIEHIPYGDEIRSFQDALKGNSANFERKLERVWLQVKRIRFLKKTGAVQTFHSGAGQKR